MSRKDGVLPRFGPLFALRWLLFDHRKAWSRSSATPFGPSWRFSAWLRCTHRCAKLGQKARQNPTYLLRRHWTLLRFPGTTHCQTQIVKQPKLIAGTGDDPVPPLHLLRGTYPHLIPEQGLFEKAIAMLLRKAALIPATHLLQRWGLLARPDKPAFLRIALGATG